MLELKTVPAPVASVTASPIVFDLAKEQKISWLTVASCFD
jgi:H+/gluconate symporter-like permease